MTILILDVESCNDSQINADILGQIIFLNHIIEDRVS